MQIVDRADQYPAHCLWTYKTSSMTEEPFLDLGRDFDERHDGRMYLLVSSAQTIGEAAGCVKPDVHQAALDALDEAQKTASRLADQVAELEAFKESVYVMTSEGYRAAKKTGRPPKNKSEVPA